MTGAKKLANGRWRIRVYDKTNKTSPYKCFTGDTQKETERMAAQYLFARTERNSPKNITLGEAITGFIDNRSNILSPATIASYRVIGRTAFPSLYNEKLEALTQTSIQKAVNEYTKGHAHKTVSNAVALLTTVLKEYRPDFKYSIHMPQKKKSVITIPTTDQVNELIEASKGSAVHLPILLAALTGMRRSEICALTWKKIDLKRKTITVDEALVLDEFNTLVHKAPKTTMSQRVLQLPQQILDALPKQGEPIITIQPGSITKHCAKLIKRLGYDFTFHALRHYYASIMLQLGVPDKYAMERMGHSTNNMLKQVYQHTFESEQDAITNKMQEYFNAHIEVNQK